MTYIRFFFDKLILTLHRIDQLIIIDERIYFVLNCDNIFLVVNNSKCEHKSITKVSNHFKNRGFKIYTRTEF